LYRKYSTKSDVWSYGMVMYEIWSLGHKPFEDFSVDEVIAALSQEYYLEAPPDCPSGIYSIMMECWNPNAMGRPNFQEIVIALDEVNNKCKQAESTTSVDIGTLCISTRANFTSRSASPAGRTGTSSTTTTNTANITLNSKDM
jgi:serine/threonine protein kinase